MWWGGYYLGRAVHMDSNPALISGIWPESSVSKSTYFFDPQNLFVKIPTQFQIISMTLIIGILL